MKPNWDRVTSFQGEDEPDKKRPEKMAVVSSDVEVKTSCCWRCSMPSLSRMPSAARNLMSNMFSFFQTSPAHNGVSDKAKAFSTPQTNRKSKLAQPRRNSDTDMNGKGGGKRIFVENIENWEPTVTEKELLRRTWSDEFEFLYNLGSSIYFYIFEHNPNCKKLFPYIESYGDSWKDSKEFRSQALKFVQTLAQVVKNVYHMDRIKPYLYDVGQRHCKFASRGFKHEYWDDFQDAMDYSLSDHMNKLPDFSDQDRAEAVRVWRTLALFVVVHMKQGFVDGLKGINAYK